MVKNEKDELTVYTIKDLAELFQVSTRTVQRYIAEGKIRGFKLGRKWFFKKEEIERIMN